MYIFLKFAHEMEISKGERWASIWQIKLTFENLFFLDMLNVLKGECFFFVIYEFFLSYMSH